MYICLNKSIMFTAIKGYYEKGQVIMDENAPVQSRTDVIITFLTGDKRRKLGLRIPGALKGKVTLPDDFNGPVDDSGIYMQ